VTLTPSRITIHHVAARAGVSTATVSKVVNGKYGVAAATSKRVQRVIDELGYEPSLVARSLRSHRTNVIGILVADLEPFSTELLKGAARGIRGTGYELVVYSAGGRTNDQIGWEHKYLTRLAGTLIDGAVLVTPTIVDAPSEVPVVAVDPHRGRPGPPTVDSDNLHGASAATQHLLDLGHRRIGFVAGRSDLESSRLREKGYRQALAAAGIPVDPELVEVGGYEQEFSETAARTLLTLPNPPSAIFAANDLSAIGVLAVAHSLGLNVPGDLSVVGFDNVPESVMADPPLTTVNQPIQEMGQLAIELLVSLLRGQQIATEHLTLPTNLVIRQSTAPFNAVGQGDGGPVVEPAKGHSTKSGSRKSGSAKGASTKSGSGKTGSAKSGSGKAGSAKSGSGRTGVTKSGSTKAGSAPTA
jgi:LacI family transcriptional regulator